MSQLSTPSPLFVTCGEPAGIGLETILKSYKDREKHHIPPFILGIGLEHFKQYQQIHADQTPFTIVEEDFKAEDILSSFNLKLPILPLQNKVSLTLGTPCLSNSAAVIESIYKGFDLCLKGRCAALVTAPIQKATLNQSGFAFPGHTEFLEHLAHEAGHKEAKSLMLLASDELKVMPFTIHIPLTDVAKHITQEGLISAISSLNQELKRVYGIDYPRIAVCGLNPHAGENGHMGREEVDTIIPAIKELQARDILAMGPLPADTMFHLHARKQYDCAVGMYHDQVLIPVKTLAFDKGVNVTLGLPILRTSPDHGTALAIADKGIASPSSMIAALQQAGQLCAMS